MSSPRFEPMPNGTADSVAHQMFVVLDLSFAAQAVSRTKRCLRKLWPRPSPNSSKPYDIPVPLLTSTPRHREDFEPQQV
ncbi:hypothetical protein TNCV_306111 [Trichonephila clavipes]|nr:hypothetical protein TNCV_306111 [Trichonephila clavipes]